MSRPAVSSGLVSHRPVGLVASKRPQLQGLGRGAHPSRFDLLVDGVHRQLDPWLLAEGHGRYWSAAAAYVVHHTDTFG